MTGNQGFQVAGAGLSLCRHHCIGESSLGASFAARHLEPAFEELGRQDGAVSGGQLAADAEHDLRPPGGDGAHGCAPSVVGSTASGVPSSSPFTMTSAASTRMLQTRTCPSGSAAPADANSHFTARG